MHTASTLQSAMFDVAIDGIPADRSMLFDGAAENRLGIVITAPLGAIGASLMIGLAMTADYDAPLRDRRAVPRYAEIYAFHVGGLYGHLGFVDIWPERKEVFVADETGTDTLRAINDRAITHLLVPDGLAQQITHAFKEPEAARDRLKRCFAYSPTGQTHPGTIAISTAADEALHDFDLILDPDRASTLFSSFPPSEDAVMRQDAALFQSSFNARRSEVSPDFYERACAQRRALRIEARLTETYREISVEAALQRLAL